MPNPNHHQARAALAAKRALVSKPCAACGKPVPRASTAHFCPTCTKIQEIVMAKISGVRAP
jgi:Zn finger protein HypA/HybF involved in hydrogenase expression